MKKLILILSLYSAIGFSQDKELYDLAFSNINNFKMLSIFNDKIPRNFQIIDSTITWNSKIFYLENVNLNDSLVMKEIEREEHHPYHSLYLFSDKFLNSKINDEEKQNLSQIATKILSIKINFNDKHYRTVEKFKIKKGFYFFVSEPIYSTDNKFAFLEIFINKKNRFLGEKLDDYYGRVTIMFEKNSLGKWNQLGMKPTLYQ